jgi:hypothetical protein
MTIERGLRLMAGVFGLLSLAVEYLGHFLLVFRRRYIVACDFNGAAWPIWQEPQTTWNWTFSRLTDTISRLGWEFRGECVDDWQLLIVHT